MTNIAKGFDWIETYSDGGEMCIECSHSHPTGAGWGHICLVLDNSIDPTECPALPEGFMEGKPEKKSTFVRDRYGSLSIPEMLGLIETLDKKANPKDDDRLRDVIVKGFQGIPITPDKPTIIALLGSSRFCGEMAIMAWEFEKRGVIALGLHLLPEYYCREKGMVPDEDGNIHHIGEQEGVEEQMDALHFKKIEMADSVYVVNIDEYIGKSTQREIEYARYLGKRISYHTDT